MNYHIADLVLHLDDHLVGINKPSGLLSLPDGHDDSAPHLRSVLEPELGRIWIVHRLDRETSGVMIMARDANAHRSLNTQFERREVHKVYHALIVGNPTWESRSIDLSLRVDGDRRHRTIISELDAISAITDVRVMARYASTCLIEAVPRTGRRHQIRAHLSAVGHPIVADTLYGESQRADGSRLALHAFSLIFQHPITLQPQTISAPYPDDIAPLFQER